ncbi:hypothetical protein HFO42_01095 [Rhizobium leguminosarum]|uniref:Uncharacterized protein n=1 Tax=Rhizobium leguminosarum TaxID=384 RepID=A0AAJ1EBH9_RHILE|nr:hypothetical protein [Rhizobium leguminosarum]MBY5532525.1 hypothetical protein [Rhizobium leguminosarum]MBY5594586.1 hypothetical protein [Rhizobium leguminosarum]MBY5615232.1 hypothetical protein [Rhizobium leguminosarum]MBY5626737.1 hypothetical protein [Rhizobium leguminosarum]MBY5731283.1 hypothetical protein [Rhizobium leguminosarum]
MLAHQLRAAGIAFSHQATGPDFRIDDDGRRIWIEVVTPTPANVPAAWLDPADNGVRDFPHEEILLRWTAAIKAKADVLIGNAGTAGYLASGIVAPEDCYVIAVNGRLMRGYDGAFDALYGISQFPFAVEATLAVGPLQVRLNRKTFEASQPEHQRRCEILKPRGLPVPADTFLDAKFSPISAIWATDIDEFTLLDRSAKMVAVHNPEATHPIPVGFLPAHDEYVARILDESTYQLDRIEGRTAPPEETSVVVDVPA